MRLIVHIVLLFIDGDEALRAEIVVLDALRVEYVRWIAAKLYYVLISFPIMHCHDAITELILELVRLHLHFFKRLSAPLTEVGLIIH